jgi:biotin-(acetyl-CoA carboxylase) ligase
MDEAEGLPRIGWQRVLSSKQTNGRGRGGSDWISDEGGLFATWSLDAELLDRFSPGLVQTSIGAIVSRVLGANMKWPNDIVNENGVKIGGVLVESANNSTIRVGVGANRTGFVEGDVAGAGWDKTLGEVDSSEVFRRIDGGISSIFETKKMIASAKIDFLRQLSWMELSRLLSRGVLTTHDDKVYRPTGLKDSGELELVGIVDKEGFQDLDGIGWIIPKSCV